MGSAPKDKSTLETLNSPVRNLWRYFRKFLAHGSTGWATTQFFLMFSIAVLGSSLIGPILAAVLSLALLLGFGTFGVYRQFKKHEREQIHPVQIRPHWSRAEQTWRYIKSALAIGIVGWSFTYITVACLVSLNALSATLLVAGMLTGTVLLIGVIAFLSTALLGVMIKKLKTDAEYDIFIESLQNHRKRSNEDRSPLLSRHPAGSEVELTDFSKIDSADADELNQIDLSQIKVPLLERYQIPIPFTKKRLNFVFLSQGTLSILFRAIGFGSIGYTIGHVAFYGLLIGYFGLSISPIAAIGIPLLMAGALFGIAGYFKYHKVLQQIVQPFLASTVSRYVKNDQVISSNLQKLIESQQDRAAVDTSKEENAQASLQTQMRHYSSVYGSSPLIVVPSKVPASPARVLSIHRDRISEVDVTQFAADDTGQHLKMT